MKTFINKTKRLIYQGKLFSKRLLFLLRTDRLAQITLLFLTLLLLPFVEIPVINLPLLETSTNAKDLLLVIIQSLAQILGIIGALILITFQIHKRAFNALAMKQLFNKGIIRNVFFFYIYSIIYSLVALFMLNAKPEYADLKYVQISAALFIVALFSLIPLIRKVYSFSHALEQARDQLENLKSHGFGIFRYYDRMRLDSGYWKALEEHPIAVITDGTTSALKEGDNIAVSQVIAEVNKALFKYLEKSTDRREMINSFLYFYRHLSQEAIKEKNQRVLSLILDALEQIHYFAAENHFLWHELQELNDFMGELLHSCLRNSLDAIVNEGSYGLQFINKAHLEKNTPSPDELLEFDGGTLKLEDLPKDRGHDKDLQWNHVSGEYMSIMAGVAEEAVNQAKAGIASSYSRALVSLAEKVIDMNNLSDEMKGRITGWAFFYAQSLTEKILRFNLWELSKLPFPFHEYVIDKALATKADYSKELLLKYSETIITLAKYNVLSSYYLNEYGAFGRGLTRELGKDKIYRQAFKLVLATCNEIRAIVTKQRTPPGAENVYSELYKRVLSLKKWLKNNKGSRMHIAWVDKELAKFSQKMVKQHQYKKYSNEWPDGVK